MHVGIDLAWGERARTGVAVLDGDGALLRSASVRTDDEIAEVLADAAGATDVVVAIDAPLVVPNETGRRDCEAEVTRLFGRYHAGAYPSNRSRPAFSPQPRGARLAARFGWSLDPRTEPGPGRRVAIEVYPHPAMVVLFGLDRVLPYKGRRGRSLQTRKDAFALLMDHLDRVCGPTLRLGGSARWQHLRAEAAAASRPVHLERIEDEVDAIVCAYLALMWRTRPDDMVVLGDAALGYIVTPRLPDGHAAV